MVDKTDIYQHKYTLFQFLHLNTAKIIIKCHDKKIKYRCVSNIDIIVYITVFNIKHKRKKKVEKYIWDLYHELVLFLNKINKFQYIPENKIEGNILGWTTSSSYTLESPSNMTKSVIDLWGSIFSNVLNKYIIYKGSILFPAIC